MDPLVGKHKHYNAATILMFHDNKVDKKKSDNFKNIIEAKWLPFREDETKPYEVPCILGASYGVSKQWYNHIDGFAGHKKWGTLEPYISLKSWLFGGNCIVEPNISTAHIFKTKGTHGVKPCAVIYNKIYVASVLFDIEDRNRLISFLGDNGYITAAKRMIRKDKQYIANKRAEYKAKTVYDIREYCKRFDIDFRDK
jgi:hypothetical protein